jgi:ketosteroid isomerase-like protein
MKKILSVSILIAACALSAVAQCSDADKKALEAFDRAWGEAGVKGDRAALMAIYADDYYGMPGMQGKMATIDNTMAAFERDKNNPNPDKVSHDVYRITCTPNSALITHRNVVWTAQGSGGKPESFYTRSVHTLEKRNGKWQVVGNSGNGLDDYDVVSYMEEAWNDAFWRRDAEWFKQNFAPDFSSISSSTGAITGKDGDIKSLMDDKSTYDLVETTNMNVNIDGNAARVTGIFHLKGKGADGKPFDTKIRYTDVWVKRDGRWVAWSSQGTTIK